MGKRLKRSQAGFSLLELTVATALGTLVVAAAVQLYSQGASATFTVSQRAEMQQDFRAASNLLTKDLSLAGAGLPLGVPVQLPTSATIPVYGCASATGSPCYLGANNNLPAQYPQQGGTPFLYGLLTGYNGGPTLPQSTGPTDTITSVYTDADFYLDCYSASVTGQTSVTFTLTSSTGGTNCTANGATIQNVNDAGDGLIPGDLVLFGFSTPIVAVVTGPVVAGTNGSGQPTYTVPFAASDALKMNQASTVPYSLASQVGTSGYAQRLMVITYYVDNTTTPARLMRQVSGHTPMPVAEGLAYLKFTYDLYNSSTSTAGTQCQNPGATTDVCYSGSSSGDLPNMITMINVAHMAMSSTEKSAFPGAFKGYQSIDLQTSVSARNLTYVNNFNIGP